LHGSLLHSVLEHGNLLNVDISRGSVATSLRSGGIFNDDFIANLQLSLLVKKMKIGQHLMKLWARV